MYCSSCGAEIPDSSAYCRRCGAEISSFEDDSDWRSGADEWGPAASIDSETLAALTHVLALFTWAVGPAVLLIASDDEFVRENSKNAINWQLTFAIYIMVSVLLAVVLVGFVTATIVSVLNLVFCLVAAVNAADGKIWDYPLTIDFI